MLLKGKKYNISCNDFINDNPNKIILAIHGLTGDQKSSCIIKIKNEMSKYNIGLISFDLPAHGVSEVDGEFFTVENCLNDIDSIINYLNKKYPGVEVIPFATSFGGYLALLYNIKNKSFKNIILRSPAIKMNELINRTLINDEYLNDLKNKGYFICGYERMLKFTQKCVDEINNIDLFDLYRNNKNDSNITIIHGNLDDIVPIEDSISFSKEFNTKFYEIDNCDHRYKKDGQLDQVVQIVKSELL